MDQHIRHNSEMLERSVIGTLEKKRARFDTLLERLNALNPLAVLQRGYSAIKDGDGKVIASAKQLNIGQNVSIMMRDGAADAQIISKELKN